MKKNDLKILLLFICTILVLPIMKVDAGNATGRVGARNQPTGIMHSPLGIKAQGKAYTYTQLIITFGGKDYEAFCIDPGLAFNPSTYTCAPSTDPGIGALFKAYEEGGYDLPWGHINIDEQTMELLVRFYGARRHLNAMTAGTVTKLSLVNYIVARDNDAAGGLGGHKYSDYMWGDDHLIWKAYAASAIFFLEAQEESDGGAEGALTGGVPTGPTGGTGGSTSSGRITFTRTGVSGNQATYSLTSTQNIDPANISFTCRGANCQIKNQSWTGRSGSITVTADCGQNFTIAANLTGADVEDTEASSNGETQVYACHNNSPGSQIVYINAAAGLGGASSKTDKLECALGSDCCTEAPISPGKIEGTVHNCCTDDTTSEAHEYNLNDLFCYSPDLKVQYFKPKCNTDSYIDETAKAELNARYCKLYCTERVSVEIPGAITATSGRYFKLSKTSHDTTSPYIEGYKRCRMRIDYKQWEYDYGKQVEAQVTNYNTYQYNEAYRKMYEDAMKGQNGDPAPSNESETTKVNWSCTAKKTCTDKITGKSYSCDTTKTHSESCTIKYKKYTFNKMYNYWYVGIIGSKRNAYKAYEIEALNGDTTRIDGDNWRAWDFDRSSCESLAGQSKDLGGCTASSGSIESTDADAHEENIPASYNKYDGYAKRAKASYSSAAGQAKKLEDTIELCDTYFDKKSAKTMYKFNAKSAFAYTQVYLNDEGKLQTDRQNIPFQNKDCEISGPFKGPDGEDGLLADQYSPIYNKDNVKLEEVQDFSSNKDLQYVPNKGGFSKYLDSKKSIDKVFIRDAKYKAVCQWKEEDNKLYTLVPSGVATETHLTSNYTVHEREYRVYLTTLDGTYETFWDISGLGEKNKFDNFFKNNGTYTCANENPADTSMLTCKLHVEYEVVLTGYCNGSNSSDTTINPEDCDPFDENYDLFKFRIVDPDNVFPSGTNKDGRNYAYNWVSEEKGEAVLQEIERRAENSKTYSPEYLTYSFDLTTNDMKHIKKYNQSQIENGGYLDFNLSCKCIGDTNSDGECKGYLSQCRSDFLTNLADGNIKYESANHDVSGWSGNKSLVQVRNSILGG